MFSTTIISKMSQQESSNKPSTRVKTKKSEDTIIRGVLKLLCDLKNEHRTPYLLSFPSKYGQLHFGSTNAVNKFKSDFENDVEWDEAFNDDHDEIIEGFQMDEDSDVDDYNHARGTMVAKKLPADLSLMIYVELWTWISQEIMKEHWLKGGNLKCVKWGDSSFEPSFWLSELWPWHEVKKHYKELPKFSYTGPGIMTDFLKKVVKNRLDMLGINHENWVSSAFTGEQRNHRERHKKKAVPSAIEREEGETSNNIVTPDVTNASEEDPPSNANEDNLSDVLNANGIDLNNKSDVPELPSATSTLNTLPRRRTSVRQAAKRARKECNSSSSMSADSFPPRPPVPPPSVSPIGSTSPLRQARTSPPRQARTSPPRQVRTSPPPTNRPDPVPTFVPRRKPLRKPSSGCSNFRSRLNINIGQNVKDRMDIHLPTDLVEKFGNLSQANTQERRETGGIIAWGKMNGY